MDSIHYFSKGIIKLRMPAVVDMSPRERQTVDLYIEELRVLFAEWKAFKGQGPS